MLGVHSAQVEMLSDNQVKIALWSYQPEQTAIEQNQPIPTPPPDGYDSKFLPTRYEAYQYSLLTNKLLPVEKGITPLSGGG